MTPTAFYHLDDADELNSIRGTDDTFSSLPFIKSNNSNKSQLEGAISGTRFERSRSYLNLLHGIDWLIGPEAEIDILNLSLGLKSRDFNEHEPLQIATRYAYQSNKVVVTAAGNDGPCENTLQSLARARWVISVGATDCDRNLLDLSSRGVANKMSPTLVTNGVPNPEDYQHPNMPETARKFGPSTSLACARMSRIAAFTMSMMRFLFACMAEVQQAHVLGIFAPPIRFVVIGFADTGIFPGYQDLWNPTVRSFMANGNTSYQVSCDHNTIKSLYDIFSFLLEEKLAIELSTSPEAVRTFLNVMAIPLENRKCHEVGSGYLDLDVAIDFWTNITPVKLLKILLPRKHHGKLVYHFQDSGPIFRDSFVIYLSDMASRGPTHGDCAMMGYLRH
ncbi:Serine protease AprX [Bremerella volcania]|uniref:Serine protease AprX n=1 Tax=Bremerella volcania TaxID=2527984 RepID=A0A518CFC3_9BACT|nr:S8 family serine peptidase [Bremerella volcania]QDU77930.1 Serine protease AprX [Bremerella volcania]